MSRNGNGIVASKRHSVFFHREDQAVKYPADVHTCFTDATRHGIPTLTRYTSSPILVLH